MTRAERGFTTANLLTAGVDLFAGGVAEPQGRLFYRQTVERLRATPQVESAAWTTFLPMSGSGGSNFRAAEVRGYTSKDGRDLSVTVDTASAGYLHTLGIPLAKGQGIRVVGR